MANILHLVVSFLVCGVAMAEAVANSDFAAAAGYGICRSVVEPQGYGCTEHKVTSSELTTDWCNFQVVTTDGYILNIQRIAGKSGGNFIPVLLQHGLFMDGITWFMLPANQNLALLLADNGYDVWIANGRGTKYSSGHVSYAPDDKAYWNWSWDEMVAFDLPAMVDYVNNQTNRKVHYVGHSQGNLFSLAAISKGYLVDKLRSVSVLCPIAYMHHMSSLLMRGSINLFAAEGLYWLRIKEFDPNGGPAQKFLQKACRLPFVDCTHLLNALTGKNCCLNPSALDSFLEYEPQPTSTRNLLHLSQMVRRGTIAMYDYNNQDENVEHYGQPSPPVYDMTRIPNDLPMFISYGGTDETASPTDVQLLLGNLHSTHMEDKLVVQYVNNFAHGDYVMAYNAREMVYEPLLGFLNRF
ncbi:Triacylglycerol lipase 2 [Linum perenne]